MVCNGILGNEFLGQCYISWHSREPMYVPVLEFLTSSGWRAKPPPAGELSVIQGEWMGRTSEGSGA